MKRLVLACLAGAALLISGAAVGPAQAQTYIEAPSLADDIAAGNEIGLVGADDERARGEPRLDRR